MGQIHMVAVAEARYATAADRIICQDSSLAAEVGYEAARLVLGVLREEISVQDLRLGVRWANALDHEVSCATDMVDHREFTARRIMHQSGRAALSRVKTPGRLSATFSMYAAARRAAERELAEEMSARFDGLSDEYLVQYLANGET